MMPTAAIKRYWDWLEDVCLCGCRSDQVHHIIHVQWQRISKDDWLVCKLCAPCHTNLHALGGDRKFLERTGHDTLSRAVLNRHNYEVQILRRAA